jgi:uncharacterized membrane protein
MSNIALIYWLTRLSNISGFLLSLSIISSVIIGIGILGYSIAIMDWPNDDDEIRFRSIRKKFMNKIWVPILLFIFYILTPNTKEAMLIIAGGKTLDYVQSDTSLKKIPYKATELILKKMEDYIDETTSDSTKTK